MNSAVDQPPATERLENAFLSLEVVPAAGGKVASLRDKASGHEFLWHHPALQLQALSPGTDYDENFYGGIDELLPNDIPETVDGLDLPDHGELWTTPLTAEHDADTLVLKAPLPLSGLHYERHMRLRSEAPWLDCDYRITNCGQQPRAVLWKLHAAIQLEPGDQITCPARTARAVAPEWSRGHGTAPFSWPNRASSRVDIAPPPNGTLDFFYLYNLSAGRMGWKRPAKGLELRYEFDPAVFPFCWLFASYGGFNDHYTAILEPCTTMPISLNEAHRLGQCPVIPPGGSLATRVSLYAGPTPASLN